MTRTSQSGFHAQAIGEIAEQLGTDPERGLDSTEAAIRLKKFGANVLEEKKATPPVLIFLEQFESPFVLLLAIAAGISFFFREWLDGVAISAVIVINAVIGFIMEYQAGRSMEALKRMTALRAKVTRNGKIVEVPAAELVTGDLIFLEAGDLVQADARLVTDLDLEVDESGLTGESVPVEKNPEVLQPDTELADRRNMLYRGTFITKGNGKAIVVATGMATELGQIAAMIQTARENATPLEKKIRHFSRKLIWISLGLVAVIFIAGFLQGHNLYELLQISIALAVAAIPEGLPIVATLALARGMMRLARQKVIVKKLSAVETLGGTSVICTDKTGTLTENRIEVHKLILPDENPVAGIKELFPPEPGFNYMKLQLISVLCNTAELIFNGETSKESGDPLETGLLKFAHKGGINIAETRAKFPKIDEEPFTSETRMMATLHRSEDSYFIAAKGAVEELLEKCSFVSGEEKAIPMDENQKQYWSGEAAKLAKSGLRVIAAAFREIKMQPEKITDQLSFAGLFGLLDPPREEVFDAIRECKSAGIDVIMVTGDHPATARTIGHELGLVEAGEDEVIPGKEMVPYSKLDENEKRRWRNAKIFARVSPAQKFDLIRVLQEKGEVVAMTGDGVNDAPALKKADIGIAMGVRGTQVAQEAAAMVLQDDSFASIVVAIRQGRIIFDNIRKFVIYLLSCNLSELLVIAVTAIAGLHFSLFPLQILYLNLLTDVFPALALGITPGSKSVMNHKPRRPDQPVIQRQNWFAIFIYAFIISACTLGAVWFSQEIVHAHKQLSSIQNNNILFLTLLLSQLWHVFNMTEEIKLPLYKSDVFRNKYAWFGIIFCIILVIISWMIPGTANALSLQSLSFADLLAPLTCSLVSFAVIRLLRKLKVVK